jgi:hypothetical protein
MTQIATLDEIAPHLAYLPNGSSSTFWMDCLHYFVIIRTIGTIELSLEGGEVYWKATERNCQQMPHAANLLASHKQDLAALLLLWTLSNPSNGP